MKKSIFILVSLFLFVVNGWAQVAINTNGSTADASSMLDIKSYSKGILIPRMSTAQRTAISSPANGLLVFDTDTKSFWFYESTSSSWKEIYGSNNNSLLADNDGDTKVDVELYSDDDIIRFFQSGTKFFEMDSGRLKVMNTGSSVFIGDYAGAEDDLSDNSNTLLGNSAGRNITTGENNIAVGNQALSSNVTGSSNIAIGDYSLSYDSLISYNVAIGMEALKYDSADNNIAIGYQAAALSRTGSENIVIGKKALYRNETGSYNIAVGNMALNFNSSGNLNIAIGDSSLASNSSGSYNFAIGKKSLYYTTTGNRNTGFGYYSLYNNTTGYDNIAIGYESMYNGGTGQYNVAIGSYAMRNHSGGLSNVALGYNSMKDNTGGNKNTAVGYQSFLNNSSGEYNIAIGYRTMENNGSGKENTAIGTYAMFDNDSGSYNVAVGYNALASGGVDKGKFYENTVMGYMAANSIKKGSYNSVVGSYALGNVTNGNKNVAIGSTSLSSLTTGSYNVALGNSSLRANDTGSYNVAVGFQSLFSNKNDENVAVGAQSLYSNDTGYNNVSVGFKALYNNKSITNTALGYMAGYRNQSGKGNVFIGNNAGYNEMGNNKLYIANSSTSAPLIYGEFDNTLLRINGTLNISNNYSFPTSAGTSGQILKSDGSGGLYWSSDLGALAIDDLTDGKTGGSSLFLGTASGDNDNLSSTFNVGVGDSALYNNISGHDNLALGVGALKSLTTGDNNIALGTRSLYSCAASHSNIAIGQKAMYHSTGTSNVIIGKEADYYNSSGAQNTMIGVQAGHGSSSHSKDGCVFIGYQAGYYETGSNKLYIENTNTTSPLVYGEFDNNLVKINGRFDVNSSQAFAGNFSTDYADDNTKVVYAEFTASASKDGTAIYGKSTPVTNGNYGYGGKFEGNYMAIKAVSDAGSSTGPAYGIYSECSGSAGTRYGVYGYAAGSATNRYGVYGSAAAVSNSYALYCDGNGVYTGTWSKTSDLKLKKDLKPIDNSLSKIIQLSPKSYKYKTKEFSFMNLPEGTQFGFVAQEIEKVFPELVTTVSHPKNKGKEVEMEEYKAVNYIGLIPMYAAAIQEQQQQINNLKKENAALKQQLTEINETLKKIMLQVSIEK